MPKHASRQPQKTKIRTPVKNFTATKVLGKNILCTQNCDVDKGEIEDDQFMAAAIGDSKWLKQSMKKKEPCNIYDKNVCFLTC